MAVHFRETMDGQVRSADGVRRFSFTVTAAAPSFWGVWGRDVLQLEGRATLEGVVGGAQLLPGSYLQIGLPFRRLLCYAVSFDDASGRRWRFFGDKQVRWLNLPLTLRRLRGTLFCDGERYGEAELDFDLRALPSFLASWRLSLPEAMSESATAH